MLAINAQLILWNLGIKISPNVFFPIGLGLLFFCIGILCENAKRNWFIGIRTPWTLSNENVWMKTHKIGAKLFKIAGVIALFGALFRKYAIFFALVPVILVAIYTIVYSYFEYQSAKNILISMFIAAFLPGFVFGQAQVRNNVAQLIKQKAARNINEFILDKLRTNRIVMLADAGHGNPLYYQTVIGILNHWVTAFEQSKNKNRSPEYPAKLYLVLELDSLRVKAIKNYFVTENSLELIEPGDFFGYQFTTATFEFFSDLRVLRLRIDDLNRQNGTHEKIQFDLFGPEMPIDLQNWSIEKRDRFFIYERDEYSSARIKELLDKFPEAKALIFYGGAHFARVKLRKQAGNQQGDGYYLGYYLTEYFRNKGGVYICDQVPVSTTWQLDEVFQRPGKTYAIDNTIFDGAAIPIKMYPLPSDGSLFHFDVPLESKHIGLVWTENFVDYIFQHIDNYKDIRNEFYSAIIGLWFRYLAVVAGKNLSMIEFNDTTAVKNTISEWKAWHASTKPDIVHDIDNLSFFKRIIDLMSVSQEPQATQYEMMLGYMIGLKVWFHAGAAPQTRAESYCKYLNQYRKSIVTENLIHLLWVGSDAEKQKAMAILKRETGKHFATAKEWMQWWYGR